MTWAQKASRQHGFSDVDVFSSVGGFDLNLDAGEDWDLTIRVRRMGRVARIEAMIDHDEGRVSYFALCRKKAGYAAGTLSFAREQRGGRACVK